MLLNKILMMHSHQVATVKRRLLCTNTLLIKMYVDTMPILLHTPAENIDKQGPSRLQQLAGPTYVKVQDIAQR